MVLSLSHTGTAKLGSRLTGHLGSFHGHTGIARAAQGVWRKKKHSCFALRGQAVRTHLVWDIISGQESLGSLEGFDIKGLKDFGRQNLRRAPSPPRSWNTGQAVGRAEQSAVFAHKVPALVRAHPQLLILTKLPRWLSHWLGWGGLFSVLLPPGDHCEGAAQNSRI